MKGLPTTRNHTWLPVSSSAPNQRVRPLGSRPARGVSVRGAPGQSSRRPSIIDHQPVVSPHHRRLAVHRPAVLVAPGARRSPARLHGVRLLGRAVAPGVDANGNITPCFDGVSEDGSEHGTHPRSAVPPSEPWLTEPPLSDPRRARTAGSEGQGASRQEGSCTPRRPSRRGVCPSPEPRVTGPCGPQPRRPRPGDRVRGPVRPHPESRSWCGEGLKRCAPAGRRSLLPRRRPGKATAHRPTVPGTHATVANRRVQRFPRRRVDAFPSAAAVAQECEERLGAPDVQLHRARFVARRRRRA